MRHAILALLALLLGGCALFQQEPPRAVVVDSFCLSPNLKRDWDPDTDTVESMRAAVVWNRYVDKRCPPKGKTS